VLDSRWILLPFLLILLSWVLSVPALALISALILAVFPVAEWWNRGALKNVAYQRQLSHGRASPGETVRLSVLIENRKTTACSVVEGTRRVAFCRFPC